VFLARRSHAGIVCGSIYLGGSGGFTTTLGLVEDGGGAVFAAGFSACSRWAFSAAISAHAVAAVQKGSQAAVIDIDQQATASKWTDRRTAENHWVVPALTARLPAAIKQAEAQGVDFLVIDTPPHSGTDAVEAARRADVVPIPVEPHLFTLETLPKLADLPKLAGNPLLRPPQ
jgi:cellulose biosynthesis protein BcsQ